MKAFYLNGNKILLYDSIDELPIVNFQKYNKFMLIDSSIGSDVNSIDTHITKIARFIKTDIKSAMQELQNMRQNMFMVANEISPKYLAFAALIHSINGEKLEDLSDESLTNALHKVREVKHSFLAKMLMGIKKKIQTELELYFPEEFSNSKEKGAYDRLKQRALLVLEGITDGKDNTSEIDIIDDYLFNLHKPNSFLGSSSVEIKMDKQFESMCLVISQETNMDAKKMTVLQYYNAIDNIKKQIESKQKAYKRYKK